MYQLIGSDNREYGPAGEDVVRRWIAEGRANGETQARKEGESGWRPLSSFPEFAAALAGPATLPPLPPNEPTQERTPDSTGAPWPSDPAAPALPLAPIGSPRPTVDANALAAALLARPVRLDITGCIGRGWELVQKHFWLCVGAWAVSFLIVCGVSTIPYVGTALALLFGGVFLGGIHWFFLRLLRGEPAAIGDVFAGFGPALGTLVLSGLIANILEGVGYLLCILPGIFLTVAWHYASIAVMDKGLDFWGAMEVSRKVVTRHWFSVFALFLLAVSLWLVGLLACCIGLFVTGPIATAAIVCAYADLFDAGEKKPTVTL